MGDRLIIPGASRRATVLKSIHEGHFGTKNKSVKLEQRCVYTGPTLMKPSSSYSKNVPFATNTVELTRESHYHPTLCLHAHGRGRKLGLTTSP